MARYYGWITPREKQSSRVSKVATPKKGNQAQSGSDDSDTEDAVHWTCACQQVHYLENSRTAHDARLLIFFAIRVLRQPPTTGTTTTPCPATAHHDSPTDSPLSDDRPCIVPYFHALSHDSPPVWPPVLSPCPTTVACRSRCHAPLSLRALSLQASVDVLLAMDVTTPAAPRVRRFVPFVGKKDEGDKDAGQKDVGQKDGAPQAAPSREFPLMSGEETTDPVLCGSAVVRTPSDAA